MDNNIIQLDQLLSGVLLTRSFQLSRNAEEKANKLGITLTADFDFSALTLQQGLDKAVRQAVIDYQQANRGNFDNFSDQQNVGIINVGEAGRKAPVDAEKVVANKFANSDRDGKIAQLVAITGMDEAQAAEMVDKQAE